MTSVAERIHETVKGHVAWTMVGEDAKRIVRKGSNQYGRHYTFDDGSRLMVPHGTAMTYVMNPKPPASPLLGKRIEIPVHYDLWMRGARFGQVTGFRHGGPGRSDFVLVKMDHPQVKRHLKLWRADWNYARIV